MGEGVSSKRFDNLLSNENLTIYLYVAIALSLVLILINVFAGAQNSPDMPSNDENSSYQSETVFENNVSSSNAPTKEMQPVTEFATAVYSCQSYVDNKDAESYCNSFSKVDFDGLQVFVNCDYSGLKPGLTSTLSCDEYDLIISDICDKNNLNDEEFVSVNDKVNTCYESKLG